jgi:hypothetical protein
LRHLLAAGAADAAAAGGVFDFTAEFHLDLLDTGERGLNAFGQQRIVGHRTRVQLPQIAHKPLDVTGGVRIVVHLLLELLQTLDRVAVRLLEILRVHRAVVVPAVRIAVAVRAVVAAVRGAHRWSVGTV